jgi:hypothetical protein
LRIYGDLTPRKAVCRRRAQGSDKPLSIIKTLGRERDYSKQHLDTLFPLLSLLKAARTALLAAFMLYMILRLSS